MKKLYVLFLLFFALPALASGIASNSATAPCTNTTLETYSGNTNLAADWQPNTINLRWYNNNTLLDVQSAANTCVYDGTLTVPSTAPNRTGYTFAGWEVRPQMDFGTIPTDTNGIERWAMASGNTCYHDPGIGTGLVEPCANADFSDLQLYEWKTKFSVGQVYGVSKCTSISGTYSTAGNPGNDNGKYCWCKATGYKPTNENKIHGPNSNLSWIFYNLHGEYSSFTSCANVCAIHCAYGVRYQTEFRTALFTPAAN